MRKTVIAFSLLLGCLLTLASSVGASEQAFSVGSFKQIIEQEKGAPLIINFWSYDCPPCLAEMPVLDRFTQTHKNVKLTLVSTDPWDQMKRIKRTLTKYGPKTFSSWVFADRFVEKIRFDIDRKWRGDLPRTYLVDRNGQITMLRGMIHEDQLLDWIKGQ